MQERWRVEELARRAQVSVDTVRFYQKRRLLPPPAKEGRVGWYGPEHLERLTRIRDLQRQGLTLALIGRIVRGELDPTDQPLAAAVVEAGTAGAGGDEELLTLDDLAARTGAPAGLLVALARDGLLAPTLVDGEPRYAASDVAIVAAGVRLVGAGLPPGELLELARCHHAMTREIAERAVAMFDDHVRTPLRGTDLPDDEKAARLVEAFGALLPAVTSLVANHFRRTLLAVAQEHLEKVGDAIDAAAVEAGTEQHIKAVRRP